MSLFKERNRMTPPAARPVTLTASGIGPLVSAEVVADFPPGDLASVEDLWADARLALPAAEHGHWDWRNKEDACGDPGGRYRLFAVRRAGDSAAVEGLMAVGRRPRPALMSPAGDIPYIDYLEVAPWNLKGWPGGPRLLGVGIVLIAEAVRRSGAGGRVGLHSLPQSEDFYRRRCGMTRFGGDVEPYPDLAYFEYTEPQAAAFLSGFGGGAS